MIATTTEDAVSTLAGIAGMLASIPAAALAFAAPQHGQLRVPRRWWRGAPAPPWGILAACLVAGATANLACARCPDLVVVPVFWLTAVLGTTLAIIDLRCHRLPHALTTLLWATGGTCFIADAIVSGTAGRLIVAVATALATSGTLLLIALAFPGQLGLGDVNLAGALALSLGWRHWSAPLVGLLAAFALQAIVVAGWSIVRRRKHDDRGGFPLGPALLLGWLILIWAGPAAD
ncbi:MAG: prepilin peptidase [Dactylosporangium sp.]|nr:A24 family peptidase [Dactylosporangium sp.]NNJ59528.1 prepilin peptidase [Dactylosporangium sp.]